MAFSSCQAGHQWRSIDSAAEQRYWFVWLAALRHQWCGHLWQIYRWATLPRPVSSCHRNQWNPEGLECGGQSSHWEYSPFWCRWLESQHSAWRILFFCVATNKIWLIAILTDSPDLRGSPFESVVSRIAVKRSALFGRTIRASILCLISSSMRGSYVPGPLNRYSSSMNLSNSPSLWSMKGLRALSMSASLSLRKMNFLTS